MDRRPSQLSGGQRQRVAIGRAIVREPAVFLFDEPLSNLDAALGMDMRMEIGKLHKQLGVAMIYVTHDQVEAMTLADKIVVLKEGRVMQTGAPMDLFHRPDTLFVAGFMGSPAMNFLDVDVKAVSGANVTVSNAALDPVTLTRRQTGFQVGQRVKLGVRPHCLHPADAATPGRLHGKVALTERHGAETMLNITLNITLNDGTSVIAALGQDAVFDIGRAVDLGFDPSQAHLFADDGTKGSKASH